MGWQIRLCLTCFGKGKIGDKVCTSCDGKGGTWDCVANWDAENSYRQDAEDAKKAEEEEENDCSG